MSRLYLPFIALLALIAPVPGLIAAGAGWASIAAFILLAVAEGALLAVAAVSSMVALVAGLLALLVPRIVAMVLALRVARQAAQTEKPWFRRWYALPLWLGLVILLSPDLWFSRASESSRTASGSMEPSLRRGERFVADTFRHPAAADLRRGDIVVFQRGDERWVKRLIGLPGDRIEVRRGVLLLNGEAVPRRLVGPDTAAISPRDAVPAQRYRETLGDVVYDIVEVSDAGTFDTTPEYQVPTGHVFVLGDNRDTSFDSRAMGSIGFIPLSHVVGQARFIFWSPEWERIGTRLD